MIHITHEGERLGIGLNIGWGPTGIRLAWYWISFHKDNMTLLCLRFEPWHIPIFSSVRKQNAVESMVSEFVSNRQFLIIKSEDAKRIHSGELKPKYIYSIAFGARNKDVGNEA